MARFISPIPGVELSEKKGGFMSALRGAADTLFETARTVKGFFGLGESQRPVPQPTFQSPTPTVTPTPTYSPNEYQQAISQGFQNYGAPLETYANVFAEAPQSADTYPVYKQFPFLLPAISILESSGGKNVTYENNPLNWAIQAQKKGIYKPQNYEQAIRDAMSGIGGRTAERGFTPEQIRTSSYYEPFRQSMSLLDLANIYAPISDNPEYGGETYARRLEEVMKIFEEALKSSRRRG